MADKTITFAERVHQMEAVARGLQTALDILKDEVASQPALIAVIHQSGTFLNSPLTPNRREPSWVTRAAVSGTFILQEGSANFRCRLLPI